MSDYKNILILSIINIIGISIIYFSVNGKTKDTKATQVTEDELITSELLDMQNSMVEIKEIKNRKKKEIEIEYKDLFDN